MQDFHHVNRGHLELPISSVRPSMAVREEFARQLEAFDGLVLSSQDDGFLRLAKMMAEPAGEFEARMEPDEDSSGLIS